MHAYVAHQGRLGLAANELPPFIPSCFPKSLANFLRVPGEGFPCHDVPRGIETLYLGELEKA